MKIYSFKDSLKPTLFVPLTEEYFLVWMKRSDIPNPEWMLKCKRYVRPMDVYHTMFEVCEKSPSFQGISHKEAQSMSGIPHSTLQREYDKYMTKFELLNQMEW